MNVLYDPQHFFLCSSLHIVVFECRSSLIDVNMMCWIDGNGNIDFEEFVTVMSRKVNATYTSGITIWVLYHFLLLMQARLCRLIDMGSTAGHNTQSDNECRHTVSLLLLWSIYSTHTITYNNFTVSHSLSVLACLCVCVCLLLWVDQVKSAFKVFEAKSNPGYVKSEGETMNDWMDWCMNELMNELHAININYLW